MNEWLTVMTSSPALMPSASKRKMQRGGAARHGAGVGRADEGRELLLEGRNLRPLRDPAAQDDAARGVRLALVHDGADDRDHAGRLGLGCLPPVDQAPQAFLEIDLGAEAEHAARPSWCRPGAASTGFTLRSGPYSGFRSEPMTREQGRGEIVEARLGAARDVEHVVADDRTAAPGCWRARCRRYRRSPWSACRRPG